MRIAGGFNAPAVIFAGVAAPSKLFERLASVEISRGVGRIGLQDRVEFANGKIELARFYVFHGEPVTGEGVRGARREQLVENFDPIRFQSASIPR